jgi:hypothetical protein
MSKGIGRLLGMMCVWLAMATSAWAIPPFWKEWQDKYLTGNPNAEFVKAATAAKCDVCHQKGMPKKLRNEYGDAVNKFVTKNGAAGLGVHALRAYVRQGLDDAAKELSSTSETFGKRIENGQLPGG